MTEKLKLIKLLSDLWWEFTYQASIRRTDIDFKDFMEWLENKYGGEIKDR